MITVQQTLTTMVIHPPWYSSDCAIVNSLSFMACGYEYAMITHETMEICITGARKFSPTACRDYTFLSW